MRATALRIAAITPILFIAACSMSESADDDDRFNEAPLSDVESTTFTIPQGSPSAGLTATFTTEKSGEKYAAFVTLKRGTATAKLPCPIASATIGTITGTPMNASSTGGVYTTIGCETNPGKFNCRFNVWGGDEPEAEIGCTARFEFDTAQKDLLKLVLGTAPYNVDRVAAWMTGAAEDSVVASERFPVMAKWGANVEQDPLALAIRLGVAAKPLLGKTSTLQDSYGERPMKLITYAALHVDFVHSNVDPSVPGLGFETHPVSFVATGGSTIASQSEMTDRFTTVLAAE